MNNNPYIEEIENLIELFSESNHGSSNYGEDSYFVETTLNKREVFIPFSFLKKKSNKIQSINDLLTNSYTFSFENISDNPNFVKWYEKSFAKKINTKRNKESKILYVPKYKEILDSLDAINRGYNVLREQQVLINNKKLAVQLGEWYSKMIFGLNQEKSTSQRGFDFYLDDNKVEVKVNWSERALPKGIKIKKSLVELSNFTVFIFVNSSFLIRDICLLDSDYIIRKFSSKGHTIFLKEIEISNYMFSKSNKHFDKIKNKDVMLRYASPNFSEKFGAVMEEFRIVKTSSN